MLLDAADLGTLQDPAALQAHAQRMLASPNAAATAARFVREWAGARAVTAGDKDRSVFTFFDDAYADSMNASFDRFVLGELRNGTVRQLLRSPEAHVDATMAGFFGVTAPAGGQWATVSLDPARYSGIATHPALLAALAHPSTTSYVHRGVFVRERLLCFELGSPPGNAMAAFSELVLPPDPTAKESSAAVRGRQDCTGCHTYIDPPGLALEQFDALGQFRSTYPSGRPIDPSGVLQAVGEMETTFSTPAELMEAIADEPDVRSCFARQVIRFGLSRMERTPDACSVEAVRRAVDASGGNLAAGLFAFIASDAFTHRRDP